MKITRAHKIKLCPNNKQANYFVRACGVTRFAYNWGLTEWQKQYKNGENPSISKLKQRFNFIKRQEFPWVMEISKCASAKAFNNLDRAFAKFFKNIKKNKKLGYPRFKRKGIKDSFYIANDRIQFNNKKVRLPKLGWVKMKENLRFEGKIMSATVSRTADKWFISVRVEQEILDSVSVGPVIGIDVGIKNLAVTSDGEVFKNPRALKKGEEKLRFLQKSTSRKKKGSNNWKKAVLKLQKHYYQISCVRQDSIHKATSAITKGVSCIGIESLNIHKMQKDRRISKTVNDASMSEFLRQIEYKSKWRGITIVKADKFYPSSKTCSKCGLVKGNLKLSDRVYKCEQCSLELDRDLNAAVNLRNLAVGSTASACCLGSSGSSEKKSETTDWAGISHGFV